MSEEVVALLKDLNTNDLYEFFAVTPVSSEKDITKAYKRKALQCHPDKNRDNPDAGKLFQKVSKAFKILTDAAAKAAYDRWIKAKQASLRRTQELSGKRKRFKEELELRETVSAQDNEHVAEASKCMEAEITRLRTEGEEWIKQQEEALRSEFANPSCSKEEPTLKLQWAAAKNDKDNGGYCTELLTSQFSRYGTLLNVCVSSKKKGRALVVFENSADATQALLREKGLSTNPLSLSWAAGQPVEPAATSNVDLVDYELLTFARLREAQKKINEQT